jgi:hypothetical protein
MRDNEETTSRLLMRRIEGVAVVSSLTANALKLAQKAAGIEMDVLRLEMEINRSRSGTLLPQELREAQIRAAEVRQAQSDCADDIVAAENEIEKVDALIASLKEA